MSYTHRVRIRWSDLDAQGHVNNALYIDYLQEARAGFLLSGPAAGLLHSGIVVVSHAVEYVAAIEYDPEPVEVILGVSHLGAARIEIAYRITHLGEPKAVAQTVLCPFDFARQMPRRLTETERDYFAAHRAQAARLRDLSVPPLGGCGLATPVEVRWSDLDRYGHVNNVKFFDYVQQARIEMTTSIDPSMTRASSGAEAEYTWLVARQDLSYLAQMDHRISPYTMRTAPTRLGRTSITLGAELVDTALTYARAATVLVCADQTGRPVELSDDTRRRLGEWLVTSRREGDNDE